MTALLAYTPFLDPLPGVMQDWWWTLFFPLAFLVSFAYKAVRVQTLDRFLMKVLGMTAQVVLGILGLGLAMYLFVEVVAPRL